MTRDDYLGEVEFGLRDLPRRQRRELLADLRNHLAELPPETDLEARLGSPYHYTAELRTAAGLERRRGPIAFMRARRPRNVVLTVGVLVALGLAIGAVVWIDSYQPVALGNWYRMPDGAVESAAGDSYSVVFHQGRPFQLGLEIQNTGRFTVHVLGVPYWHGNPIKARLLMYPPNHYGGMTGPLRRFHPFDLRAGERDMLLLKGVYAHCSRELAAGADIVYSLPVRYSFLWRTSTVAIPFPEELAIVFRHDGNNCG